MTDVVALGLILLSLLLGIVVVLFVAILIQMLRLKLWPMQIVAAEEPPVFSSDQMAAIAELEALGLKRIANGDLVQGFRRYATLLFRHETRPVFASLAFLVNPHASYQFEFWSVDAKGDVLETTNRVAWVVMSEQPGVRRVDAYADTTAGHWQAHLARLEGVSLVEVSDDEARQRWVALSEGAFSSLQNAGAVRKAEDCWHPTLGTAVRVAAAWFRVQRKLAVRYMSPVTSGDHQSAFFATCYMQMEAVQAGRSPRRDVKAWVLVITGLALLLLWGVAFSWSQAVAIMFILLAHEAGHALAMRVFGYRNGSRIFVPYVGAMVSGAAKELTPWKHAIVLLAVPIPGLLAGIGVLIYLAHNPQDSMTFDWRMAAIFAIAINLIDLLPITHLVGGRLPEVLPFYRWPRLRLPFAVLSLMAFVGLALWLNKPVMWLVVALVGAIMAVQPRIMRMQAAWREGLSLEQQLRNLFEVARQSFRVQTFTPQYPFVKAVLTLQEFRKPRVWKS